MDSWSVLVHSTCTCQGQGRRCTVGRCHGSISAHSTVLGANAVEPPEEHLLSPQAVTG